jgi:hypothetical protein
MNLISTLDASLEIHRPHPSNTQQIEFRFSSVPCGGVRDLAGTVLFNRSRQLINIFLKLL